MRRTWILLPVLLVLSTGLFAAEGKFARVINPPALPDDVRIAKAYPNHVDNPAAFQPSFKDKAAWEKRAGELREQVLVANGVWPMPVKTPLNAVIHGKVDRDDYTVEKVFFASLPGHYVSGNLYRPKGRTGKLPAVLCPHGHWANGRFYENGEAQAKKEIDSGAEKMMEGARYPLQARCAMLARMGCVVFFYDMVGNADSKQIPHTQGFSDAEADLRLQGFMGLQTWNSIRALDFITSLPEVDAKRVGVTGASGGGTQTFILCAVDDRPAVSFPAVMVSTKMQGGCICENSSLLRVGTNNIELAALFAPKAQAMTGANDWTNEIESKGLPELKSIYGLYGAADKVHAKYAPFPHNYNQVSREMMYNWMNKHLGINLPEPIVEKPFTPIPPKELSVYNEEHPLPKDAADARGVRQSMTAASDKQLAALAKNPEEYRRVVGGALRAMVHDRLPTKDMIEPALFKEIKTDRFTVHQALLTRKGSGERIPVVGLIPPAWKGDLVLWVHPLGKASMFQDDGKPVPAVQSLLDQKLAVMGCDVFLTGEFHLPDQATPLPPLDQRYHKGVPFAGYTYGYNRSILGNRVHDLLTVVALARGLSKGQVHLVAFDRAGTWGLLARALAGDAINRSAIDLGGFDFDQVKTPDDEMMLPGALKYGGVYGFVPLINTGETVIYNGPKSNRIELAQGTKGTAFKNEKATPEALVGWLLR